MTFGETLRGLRKKKGQTQREVAAALGISQRTYAGYEKDERKPRTKERLRKLAQYFDIDETMLTAAGVTVKQAEEIQYVISKLQRPAKEKEAEKEILNSFKFLVLSCGWTPKEDRWNNASETYTITRGGKTISLDFALKHGDREQQEYVLQRILTLHLGKIALQDLPPDSSWIILSNSERFIEYAKAHPAKNLMVPIATFHFTSTNGNIISPDFMKYLVSIG